MSTPALSPVCVFSPHPLLPQQDRQFHYAVLEPGETLGGYLERVGILDCIRHRPVVVTIDHYRVPRDLWHHCRPKPGTLVNVQCIVHGGDGKNPIATILSIGLMFVAPYLAVNVLGFAAGTLAATIAGAAISFVGNLAINALFPAPKPQLSAAQGGGLGGGFSPTYSLSGGSNRMRPYEPMPVPVGVIRVFPDLGARPYTEFQGEDQYLYQVFDFGYNDIDLSDFKIGQNPLGNFLGVTMEESGPDGALTLFPANVDTTAGAAITGSDGAAPVRTSSPNATALAVQIEGALFSTDSPTGTLVAWTIPVRIQYRAVGSAVWLPFVDGQVDTPLTNGTRKPLRRTYWRQVPLGQYEVIVNRQIATHTDDKYIEDVHWTQLRTYQPDTADYTGRKRVALKIKASGQINGVVEQFSAMVRAKTQVWNGAAWVTAQTSNPAYWVLAVARGKFVGGRRMWGAGLADARIGLENIKAFAAWCQAKGLTCNGVFDQPISAFDMLSSIALRGRGTISNGTGKLEVVWDAPDQPVVAVFGMSNIRLDSFEIDYTTENLADEVVANFFNAQTEQRDMVRVLAPGVSAPVRSRNIELFLCDNPQEAGRDANLYIAANEWRTRRYRWRMDWDGMPASKGDVGRLSHDLASFDYSGRLIEGSTAAVLKLERKVPLNPAGSWVTLAKPDGTFATYAVQGGAGDSATLNLVANLPFNPSDPGPAGKRRPYDYRWLYGHTATPGRKIKIESIVLKGHDTVELTALDEVPEYYASENNPYLYTPPRPVFGGAPELANLQINEDGIRAANGYLASVIVTWDAGGDYFNAEVRASVNGGPLTPMGETRGRSFEFPVTDGSDVVVEVTAWTSLGRLGQTATLTVAKTVNFSALFKPANVTGFALAGDIFSWQANSDVDVVGYRIRFHYGNRRTWADANPLHDGLITESPWQPLTRPAGPVTFLIVAVDAAGLESAEAAFIVTDLGDPLVANVVTSFDLKAAGFPGTVTNGAIGGGNLEAADATGAFWSGNDAAPFWVSDGNSFWSAVTYRAMSYEFTVTPVTADAGSTLTIDTTVQGDPYTIEYRQQGPAPFWSGDDNVPFWSGDNAAPFWQGPPAYLPWPGAIVARAEPYDFRITTGQSAVRGIISELTVTLDVPDIEESIPPTDIPAGGLILPITHTYRAIVNVQATLFSDGGNADNITVDNHDTAGPLVHARQLLVAVAGKGSFRIKGY